MEVLAAGESIMSLEVLEKRGLFLSSGLTHCASALAIEHHTAEHNRQTIA
jgi:hypothetical protein